MLIGLATALHLLGNGRVAGISGISGIVARPLAALLMRSRVQPEVPALLFIAGLLVGVGWGVAGYCPGPAQVSMGSGSGDAGLFVLAMLAGTVLHDRVLARRR